MAKINTNVMGGKHYLATLVDGVATVFQMLNAPIPATVFANPTAGDTISVSYSLDNGTTYTAWPNGPVTAASSDVLTSGITHLQFQRTAGTNVTSTVGVC